MQGHRTLLAETDPEVHRALSGEESRQRSGIELIASENYVYPEVLAALGSVFTNKYAEGYPGRRYYAGQEFTDAIENLARERAKRLFRCEHANVQPLSGSPMNQAVYLAFMKPGDRILGMDLSHGGHLTHGAPVSHMGQLFDFVRYKTLPDEGGRIDFDALAPDGARNAAQDPALRVHVVSARSRLREFQRIAEEAGAISMADISHIGGLVAGGVMKNPFDDGFDIVTTTTHKSLRGPRSGLVLCKKKYADAIDKSVFPGLQGGPHMNVIAAVAIALRKAEQPEFRGYCERVLQNSKALARGLLVRGAKLVTGGTDNHLMVVDTVKSFGIDGKTRRAEAGTGRHHDQQTGDSGRSQATTIEQRHPPGNAGGHHSGNGRSGHGSARGMDRPGVEDQRAVQDLRISGEVTDHCATFPVPGL